MADYSGNDYYHLDYRWSGGRWMVAKCFDHSKWRGPLEVLLAELPRLQRLEVKNRGYAHRGKIVYDPKNGEYILTFPKFK